MYIFIKYYCSIGIAKDNAKLKKIFVPKTLSHIHTIYRHTVTYT